jgi:hypothetical protein
MKKTAQSTLLLLTLLFLFCACGSDVPKIEAAEKEAVQSYLEAETEVSSKLGEAADSLIVERKKKLAESANSSPHKSKSCDEILVWLEQTVKNYVTTGDTVALNSFVSIENDVIFNSCLQSENKDFRNKYDKILELLE